MRHGSVSKLRFPDPGFDRFRSNRCEWVSSMHRTPLRSASNSFRPTSRFVNPFCNQQFADANDADSRAARNLPAPLSRSRSVSRMFAKMFAKLWPLTCKRFRGYSWLNPTRPNGSRHRGRTQVIAADVDI
jgi:hypothetical protein